MDLKRVGNCTDASSRYSNLVLSSQMGPRNLSKRDAVKAVTLAKNVAFLNISGAEWLEAPWGATRTLTAYGQEP